MTVHYHNRRRLSPEKEEALGTGIEYVSFDELLSRSDVISLNLSLTPHTKKIIGASEFEKMKNGVVIVNTARGELIDEKALLDSLGSGKVRVVHASKSWKNACANLLEQRFTLLDLTFTPTSLM